MRMRILLFLASLAALAVVTPKFGRAMGLSSDVDEFEGIYTGSIELEGTEPRRTVPLSVSLVLTDDLDAASSNLRRIAGAFLVAEEGGPYAFNSVNLRIDNARIEMRYLRSGLAQSAQVPASFLLAGVLKSGGVIEGDAVSGVSGILGKFKIKRDPKVNSLLPKRRYVGAWQGYCLCSGESKWMTIDVGTAATSAVNPEDFELEFTPGKVGSLSFGSARVPLGTVYVDFLRDRMQLRTNIENAQWVIDARIDFARNGDLVGTIVTPFLGSYGSFRLRRSDAQAPLFKSSADGLEAQRVIP